MSQFDLSLSGINKLFSSNLFQTKNSTKLLEQKSNSKSNLLLEPNSTEIKSLINLQTEVYAQHVKVESVTKLADSAGAVLRRLTQAN